MKNKTKIFIAICLSLSVVVGTLSNHANATFEAGVGDDASVGSSQSTASPAPCSVGPWFSAVTKVTNPLGSVLDVKMTDNSAMTLEFTNKGVKSDLIIGSLDTNNIYPGYRANEGLANYRPDDSIIGHQYEPNVLIAAGNGGMPESVYYFYGGWNKAMNETTTKGDVLVNNALDYDDHYVPKQKYGPSRPADVQVPAPDHETMYAFYGGNKYDIDLDITYSLNQDYKDGRNCGFVEGASASTNTKTSTPPTPAKQKIAGRSNLYNWTVIGILILVLLAIIGGCGWVLFRRFKKKNIVLDGAYFQQANLSKPNYTDAGQKK